MDKISKTEKDRRKKISDTMKNKYKMNELYHLRTIPHPGPSKSARKKLKITTSKIWKENRVTYKQRQTLFKKGVDSKRNTNQIFKIGHEVPESWRAAVKENRKHQIFPKIDSSIEQKIQDFLKRLKIEFYTHQYMHIEHGYQCDILIPSQRTVIECFGDYWHSYPYGKEVDSLRCQELRAKGFRVLVFWENEIRVMELNDFKPYVT
jgi:G:T-mismatch repair DNA endonuclease (very short patch repair protein)